MLGRSRWRRFAAASLVGGRGTRHLCGTTADPQRRRHELCLVSWCRGLAASCNVRQERKALPLGLMAGFPRACCFVVWPRSFIAIQLRNLKGAYVQRRDPGFLVSFILPLPPPTKKKAPHAESATQVAGAGAMMSIDESIFLGIPSNAAPFVFGHCKSAPWMWIAALT